MPHTRRSFASGFTLIEVTVATGLLVTIALGSAQLFVLAIRQNVAAKQQLMMSTLAADKVEELSASAAAGAVTPSPADALDRSVDGFVDFADGTGMAIAAGAGVPDGAMYVRRWLVTPLSPYGNSALVLVVRVTRTRPGPGDAQIVTICGTGSS